MFTIWIFQHSGSTFFKEKRTERSPIFTWAFLWATQLETTLRKMKPKGVQHESILEHFGVHLGSFWSHFEAGGAPETLWAALGAGVVKKRGKSANFPPKAPPLNWGRNRPKPKKHIFRRLFCGFLVAFSEGRFWERKSVVQRGSKSTKVVQNQ